jgi:hypothetical protein
VPRMRIPQTVVVPIARLELSDRSIQETSAVEAGVSALALPLVEVRSRI